MDHHFLIKTDYFNKRWTWIKRGFEFLAALGFLFWLHVVESESHRPNYPWIKYFLFAVLTVYIFGRPKDELALDKENFYYIKRSIFPFFNRMVKYPISSIKSIGCGGLLDTDTEFLGRARPTRNRLEIIFKDNSSRSHDVTIYKKQLKVIVKNVQLLLNGNKS